MGQIGYVQHPINLYYIFGPLLFVFIMTSTAWLLITVVKNIIRPSSIVLRQSLVLDRLPSAVTILLLWVFLNYTLIGFWHNAPLRFIMPIVPALAIIGGIGAARLWEKKILLYKLLIIVVILFSAWYSVESTIHMIHDSRYDAQEWILNNIPSGSTIDLYAPPYTLPTIPVTREHFLTLPHRLAYTGASPMKSTNTTYHVRYDLLVTNYSISDDEFSKRVREQVLNGSEYIITSEFQYGRFFGSHDFVEGVSSSTSYPARTAFFKDLLNEKLGYNIIAEFKYDTLLHPNPQSVNPKIIILKKRQYVLRNTFDVLHPPTTYEVPHN